MRYRIPVALLATVAVVGYGCVQGKVLTDPADTRQSSDTSQTNSTISLLVISPTSVGGSVGSNTALTATAQNQSGQPINGTTFTWASSNPQVASVDNTGMVTLVSAGSAKISATAGGLTTSVPAVATAAVVHVAAVSVTPGTVTLNPTNTAQLNAVLTDSAGNVVTGFAVTWSSSNTSVATVSTNGLLTAVAVGSAVITASSNGKTATVNATVVAQSPASVASVTVAPTTVSVTTGHSVQLTASVKDSVGNVLGGRTVTWSSSNPSVATVSSTGLVSGIASGAATISAASGGQQGTASVTVNPVSIAQVIISPASANLSAHQTLLLIATLKDANGNVITGQSVTWASSNTGVAQVQTDGLVTVVTTAGSGSASISATAGGKQGAATITIINAPVATVTMSPTSVTLAGAGKTAQLSATAKDAYGDVITGDAASWSSSNTGVATVSSSGLVTAVAAGSAKINVSIGGVATSANVTVTAAAVAQVIVSPASVSITAGQSSPLTATAKDGSGNIITGLAQTWTSSNTAAATVSSSGIVTGVAAGSATITVTIGGKSANAAATVTSSTQTVATVSVSPSTPSLQVGNQMQLTATDKTSGGTVVTGQSVTWSSSNTSVATVASSGIVTAIAAGGATITATSDGVRGTASLTVSAASGGGPYHEPAGMNTQINTGPMTTAPATSYPANTWSEGGTTFTNFSPTTMSSTGEWSQNLTPVPDGSGVRFNYGPTLAGGNSPVRMGTSIPNSGTGYLYIRWKYRLSPNWTLSQASGLKVMEPRTVNSTENHVLGAGADGQATDGSNMWFGALLQFMPSGGPTQGINVPGNSEGQSPVPSQVFQGSTANVGGSARGAWHVMEAYYQPESPAGAGNGQLTLWVDGTQVFQTGPGVPGSPPGGTHFFLAGESMGWNYLMFDPTYGGDQSTDHPPTNIYWDIDQLYVSTK